MATWYINADSGNDTTGDGSSGTPYLTISKAHTEASAADTIVCQDSTATYTWGAQTFSKALTIQGEQDDGSGAVFDAGSTTITTVWTFNATCSLSKMTFQGLTNPSSWPGLVMNVGADSVDLSITQCVFGDIAVGGRNGFQSHGLVGSTAARTGCTITFDRNLCLPTLKSSNSTLGQGGSYMNWRGASTMTVYFRNNTISIGEFTGEEQMERIIDMSGTSGSTVDFRNNILYSVETQDVEICNGYGSLSSYQFTNNCYYTTGSAYTQVFATGSNNITTDPLFVDLANGNYNLRQTSPCIDTGVLI